MSHFNIQITVQQVTDEPAKRPTGPMRGLAEPTKGDRQVIETVRVNVTAATEAEAFAKARKLMDAAEPEPERKKLPVVGALASPSSSGQVQFS